MSRGGLIALTIGLMACGASPRPEPAEVVADRTSYTVVPSGLQLVFPQVDAQEARRQVFSCRFNPPSDNPRLAGIQCPVDLGGAHVEVDEGPAGVTVMIRIGARPAQLLRDWYQRNLR